MCAHMTLDLVFPLALVTMLAAAYVSYRTTQRDLHAERDFADIAVRTWGRVVDLTPGHVPTPDRPTAFRAVVEFVRQDGSTVRVATRTAQAPAPARLGEHVEIAVDPHDATRIELADQCSGNVPMTRWATPALLAAVAVATLITWVAMRLFA